MHGSTFTAHMPLQGRASHVEARYGAVLHGMVQSVPHRSVLACSDSQIPSSKYSNTSRSVVFFGGQQMAGFSSIGVLIEAVHRARGHKHSAVSSQLCVPTLAVSGWEFVQHWLFQYFRVQPNW